MNHSIALDTDSYKYTHYRQFPPDMVEATAYLEARGPYTAADHRLVVFGTRAFYEDTLSVRWTEADVDMLAATMERYAAGGQPHPWPEHLFRKFVNENDGYFPITVEAMMDGDVVYPHTPIIQVTARNEYAPLVTWLETRWTRHYWYPMSVSATSRYVRTLVEDYYEASVDPADFWTLDYRLHDFGSRGVTCEEQARIGGTAHLLHFKGSDTVAAAAYAQWHLNDGVPVAESIPAMEHATVLAWPDEHDAYANMMTVYGDSVYAMVADTYDYNRMLTDVLPRLRDLKLAGAARGKPGFLVIRPDSGDPVECVIAGLRALDAIFGATVNSKGFRVLNGCGVIQGDGISPATINAILSHVLAVGYSAQNVAFGMGGALLQKVHRDTLRIATKLSRIKLADGTVRHTMKCPATDPTKDSMPGRLSVHDVGGVPVTFPVPCAWDDKAAPLGPNRLTVIYDNGPLAVAWPTFDAMRARIKEQFATMPKVADVVSPQLKAMQAEHRARRHGGVA